MTTNPVKVAFLTYSLQVGGAERQLNLIAKHLDRRRFEPIIIALYPYGRMADELKDGDIRIISPQKRGRFDVVGFAIRLVRILRSERPEIVYSFSEYPNLLNELAKPFAAGYRSVWGLRASDNQPGQRGLVWRAIFALSRPLSRRADWLISNSDAGKSYHVSKGYPARRISVVPNGIDTALFTRDETRRRSVRENWGITDNFVVGICGRVHPKKDVECFLRVAERLATDGRLIFVVAGDDRSEYGREMRKRAASLVAKGRLIWLGDRADVPSVINGFDLFCQTSAFGEGHSNALVEAMSCACPSVATECGDSRAILADDRWITSPGDDTAIAERILQLFEMSVDQRATLGQTLRQRVLDSFTVSLLIERTEDVLESVVPR